MVYPMDSARLEAVHDREAVEGPRAARLPHDSMSKKDGGGPPDPEVEPKAKRRHFSAAYKLRVLDEADRCHEPGQIAALLRREGLYSSHLTTWRAQRRKGALKALSQKRGRKGKSTAQRESAQLARRVERLEHELHKANIIIDAQKKLAEILGVTLPTLAEMGVAEEDESE